MRVLKVTKRAGVGFQDLADLMNPIIDESDNKKAYLSFIENTNIVRNKIMSLLDSNSSSWKLSRMTDIVLSWYKAQHKDTKDLLNDGYVDKNTYDEAAEIVNDTLIDCFEIYNDDIDNNLSRLKV